MAKTSPAKSPTNDERMVATWPRVTRVLPRGRCLCGVGRDSLHITGDAAEIAALHAGVDVNHGPDVIVADDAGSLTAGHAGKVLEKLRRRRGRRVDRYVVHCIDRVDLVLRSLHRNVVGNAILRVEPEVRRGLEAGARAR